MSFIALMTCIGLLSALARLLARREMDIRGVMRDGMAGGFIYTGIDHFANATSRYLPMMPDFFEPLSLELVWFTGVAELAGAVGLLITPALYRRLGLPDLRYWAGVGLAVMLGLVVIANVNVALRGTGVAGMDFGAVYFWIRPLVQPLIILWALYVSGVIGQARGRAVSVSDMPRPEQDDEHAQQGHGHADPVGERGPHRVDGP